MRIADVGWIGVSVAIALAAPALAQQRFTTRAEGVRVDVLVTEGSRPIRGLSAADFEVRDNGVVQTVSSLEVERIPLNIVCVLDTSGSVAGKRLAALSGATNAVVSQLREGDRAAIVSFATGASLAAPLTGDRAVLQTALAGLRADGLTSLRDATFTGLTLRDTDVSRALLLVFSDGADTSSWMPAERVIEAAKRTDVVIYPVQTPPAPPPEGFVDSKSIGSPGVRAGRISGLLIEESEGRPDTFLETIAETTGGRLKRIERDGDLTETFKSILGEFRERYVIGYVPEGVSAGGWHELNVRVKGRSSKVTARRGYYAPTPEPRTKNPN